MSQRINPEYPNAGKSTPDDYFGLSELAQMETIWTGLSDGAPIELEGITDPIKRLEAYKQTEEFRTQIGPLYKRHHAMHSKSAKKSVPEPKVIPPFENLSDRTQELITEIREFLEAHAVINEDDGYQVETVTYVMDDATTLHTAMEQLRAGEYPALVESNWDSGAYKPFSSEFGRAWHNDLVHRINNYH